jgi:uncharacterized membrane-anchored protein
LSVVALSYYILGLIGYLLKGAEAIRPELQAAKTLGLLTPVVLIGVALILWRVKTALLRRHSGGQDAD